MRGGAKARYAREEQKKRTGKESDRISTARKRSCGNGSKIFHFLLSEQLFYMRFFAFAPLVYTAAKLDSTSS